MRVCVLGGEGSRVLLLARRAMVVVYMGMCLDEEKKDRS